MILFNLAKVHPEVKSKLDSQEKLIVDTLNELVDFCNTELPNKVNPTPLAKMTSSLWADSEIIPATIRLSTTKLGINTGTEIVQRPTLIGKAKTSAHKLTTKFKDSFTGNITAIEDKISMFKVLEKELKSRHAYLKIKTQQNPDNPRFQELMMKTTLGLMMIEGLTVHAKNILSQNASIDCIKRVITPILDEKLSAVMAFQAKKRLFNRMEEIIQRHEYIGESDFKAFTKEDALAARQEMDEICAKIGKFINNNKSFSHDEKTVILAHVAMAKTFFYSKNDLNYSIPLEETTSAKYRRKAQTVGSTISVAALATGLVATPFVFTPLAPIAAPVATVAGLTSLATGLPVAISKGEEALSNTLKYGVMPSQSEAVTVIAALGSMATAGLFTLVGGGLWSRGLQYMLNGGKLSLSTKATINRKSHQDKVEKTRRSSDPAIQCADTEQPQEEEKKTNDIQEQVLSSSSPGLTGLFSITANRLTPKEQSGLIPRLSHF